MKKLIVAAALIVSTAALAQTQIVELLRPSPWTIGIAIGKWVFKDQKKIFYVEVTAQANNLESARESAFRMAVERAVGTVISSEKEVVNFQLQRNEIITYASGYVDNYELVQQQTVNNQTQVQMKVWVSHSAISNRLLNVSRDAGSVEGGRISEQIRSVQRERESADRLLSTVLADYPRRAFDIRLEPTRVVMTDQRQGELHIPFVVSWNSRYINSITEVVTRINQKSDCNKLFRQCTGASMITVAGEGVGYFDDTAAYDLMHREMLLSRPQIQISIRDQFGTVQFRQCYSAPELDYSSYATWHYIELGGYRATINTSLTKRFTIPIDLAKMPTKSLDQVDIAVIRKSGCLSNT